MLDREQVIQSRGANLIDTTDSKVGTIEDIYLDRETDQPEWAAVKTGMIGSRLSFVPLADASAQGSDIRVPYAKDQIKDAPSVEADGELSQQEEAELYRHYGLDYSERSSDTGLPEGGTGDRAEGYDTSGPTTDDAMTRSEEELRVGTAQREAGRARLRKYVVTEQQTQTVPVQREEVRVEREPITEANVGQATTGPDISDEEHEVVLTEEEPVVEKKAVPKERVRLAKEPVTEDREVSEEVRKEQIEEESGLRR